MRREVAVATPHRPAQQRMLDQILPQRRQLTPLSRRLGQDDALAHDPLPLAAIHC